MEKTVTYCGQEPRNKALGMFRYQDRNPKEVGLGYRENVQVGSLNRTKWARLVRCWPVHFNGWLMPRPVLLKDRLLGRKGAERTALSALVLEGTNVSFVLEPLRSFYQVGTGELKESRRAERHAVRASEGAQKELR